METQPDLGTQPLANVVLTVDWLLNHLAEPDLAQFKSQLPKWDAGHVADLTSEEVDTAVKELDRWLHYWVDRAKS